MEGSDVRSTADGGSPTSQGSREARSSSVDDTTHRILVSETRAFVSTGILAMQVAALVWGTGTTRHPGDWWKYVILSATVIAFVAWAWLSGMVKDRVRLLLMVAMSLSVVWALFGLVATSQPYWWFVGLAVVLFGLSLLWLGFGVAHKMPYPLQWIARAAEDGSTVMLSCALLGSVTLAYSALMLKGIGGWYVSLMLAAGCVVAAGLVIALVLKWRAPPGEDAPSTRLQVIANSLWFWIVLIFLLCIILNGGAFTTYHYSHIDDTASSQVWAYLESDAFKVITASLMLPFLLLLLERVFNIRSSIEERIRIDRLREREKRMECIEETAQVWNRLYALVTEVVNFSELDNSPATRELIRRLEGFRPECERMLNMWHFRFPNLKLQDTSLPSSLMNALLSSAITVAYSIRDSRNKEKTTELLGCLGDIRDGVTTTLYHPMVSILQLSTDVLDKGVAQEQRKEAESEVQRELKHLEGWAKELETKEKEYNTILPESTSIVAESVKEECRKLLIEWRREHAGKPFKVSDEEAKRVQDSIVALQSSTCGYVTAYPYSTGCVHRIAAWLAFESICEDLQRTLEPEGKVGGEANEQEDHQGDRS